MENQVERQINELEKLILFYENSAKAGISDVVVIKENSNNVKLT